MYLVVIVMSINLIANKLNDDKTVPNNLVGLSFTSVT